MVRPKKGEHPLLTAGQIKDAARKQMAAYGTAGLSLRGIARELHVTAPAIYHYFPSLDQLITALIVDAYNDQAGWLENASRAAAHRPTGARLLEVLLAYRTWALGHFVAFSLIYGNPIPRYHAPETLTEPAASRVFQVILEILAEGYRLPASRAQMDRLDLPEGLRLALPESTGADPSLPTPVLYLGVAGWYRVHGLIMLELFGHLGPMVNDTGWFYEHEVRKLIHDFGFPME